MVAKLGRLMSLFGLVMVLAVGLAWANGDKNQKAKGKEKEKEPEIQVLAVKYKLDLKPGQSYDLVDSCYGSGSPGTTASHGVGSSVLSVFSACSGGGFTNNPFRIVVSKSITCPTKAVYTYDHANGGARNIRSDLYSIACPGNSEGDAAKEPLVLSASIPLKPGQYFPVALSCKLKTPNAGVQHGQTGSSDWQFLVECPEDRVLYNWTLTCPEPGWEPSVRSQATVAGGTWFHTAPAGIYCRQSESPAVAGHTHTAKK